MCFKTYQFSVSPKTFFTLTLSIMVSSKFYFIFLLLFQQTFSLFPTVEPITSHDGGIQTQKIVTTLSDEGYIAMSLTLEMTLDTLISPVFANNTTKTVTIFCPPDEAFMSSKYPQPPLTLLQYHIALVKLDREALESSTPLGSKINTLLPGHPLVVTTTPHSGQVSINDAKITQWNLYNDGHVVVHGVENFFDPVVQTLRYPRFDGGAPSNDENSSNVDVMGSSSSKEVNVFTRVIDALHLKRTHARLIAAAFIVYQFYLPVHRFAMAFMVDEFLRLMHTTFN